MIGIDLPGVTLVCLLSSALCVISADAFSFEIKAPTCIVIAEENTALIENITDPFANYIDINFICEEESCRGAVNFNKFEILSFESSATRPMELCLFAVQQFDLRSLGRCSGTLHSVGIKIARKIRDESQSTQADDILSAATFRLKYSESPGFSPKLCISRENIQLDHDGEYFPVIDMLDSSNARVEITKMHKR